MTSTTTRPGGLFGRAKAILLQRCPCCFRGRVFRGLFRMNDPCPACGALFEREEGYFLGAMYVSYALGAVLVGAAYFAASAMWPDVGPWALCLGLFAGYLPLMPVIYRYSRVIWMHLDRIVSPSDTDAGAYEKLRGGQRRPPG